MASTTEARPSRPRPVQGAGRGRGGALLVVGATSGAGKSTVVTGLCRALARRGLDVAPFKAQNMSNHGAVTPDGGEIGRAQAVQALAAWVETDRRMAPVLLKPSGARTSHVVVLGDEVGVDDAVGYGDRAAGLRPVALEALQSLRDEHDVVVLEGAGGAAEINLLDRDLVNLPLAAAAGLPAVLVVDIERGGAFAAAYGTWALLAERLRARLRGLVINAFRGDVSLLEPGLRDLERRTGVPVLGVLPHLGDRVMLGAEDSLDLGRWPVAGGSDGERPVRVAVVRLPSLADPSDLDPLVLEPSVDLRWATRSADLSDADLVVLPGSRSAVDDLGWLRSRDLDAALQRLAADPAGPHLLGIGAGYELLGDEIDDQIESGRGRVAGLGLLPVRTAYAAPKTVRRLRGRVSGPSAVPVAGYQAGWGRTSLADGAHPWFELDDVGPEGCLGDDGRVRGTSIHGLLDSDELRHSLLGAVAAVHGRSFVPSPVPYEQALDEHLEHLADWVEENLDVERLLALAGEAVPVGQEPGW